MLHKLKKYRGALIWSALIAALMSAANYFANNQVLYTVEDMRVLYACTRLIGDRDGGLGTEAYFVNTAYDKALADGLDPGHPQGSDRPI